MSSKKQNLQTHGKLDEFFSKLQSKKLLKRPLSKTDWIQESIKEYLTQASEKDFIEKPISIAFEKELEKKIEQKINSVRKSAGTINKKKSSSTSSKLSSSRRNQKS
jgi:hypothetical protein